MSRKKMSRTERAEQIGGGAASDAGTAIRLSTRRSWLAGLGAVFAASALPGAKTLGADSTEPGFARSIWPYENPGLQFVLEARVTIGPLIELGDTSHGHRRIIPITGGTFHGP